MLNESSKKLLKEARTSPAGQTAGTETHHAGSSATAEGNHQLFLQALVRALLWAGFCPKSAHTNTSQRFSRAQGNSLPCLLSI